MAERLVFLKRKRVSSTQMPPSTLTMKRTRMYVGVMMLALTKPSMNHAWDADVSITRGSFSGIERWLGRLTSMPMGGIRVINWPIRQQMKKKLENILVDAP